MANNVKYSEWWDAYAKMYIGHHSYYCPLTITSSGVGAAPMGSTRAAIVVICGDRFSWHFWWRFSQFLVPRYQCPPTPPSPPVPVRHVQTDTWMPQLPSPVPRHTCISYTAALPLHHVTQQQQQHTCCCEGGCHLVDTGRQHGCLQYLTAVPVHWGQVRWVTTDSITWLSVSDRTLAVLLDHSQDLDLVAILARMADWSEP